MLGMEGGKRWGRDRWKKGGMGDGGRDGGRGGMQGGSEGGWREAGRDGASKS